MDILVGSSNPGKILEIHDALRGLSLGLLQPADIGITDTPHEHGATYTENALLKARWYSAQSKLPTIADDSGIVVDALAGELGVHTRRWGAGADATDEEWIGYFLRRMESEHSRSARFVCVIAYVDAEGKEFVFEGTCEGVITSVIEAPLLPGLPLSSVFKPIGSSAVYSAMNSEQKNSTSHRGKALQKLQKFFALQQEAM